MELNRSSGPFIESPLSTAKMMRNLIIALIPIIIFAFIKNGVVPYQKGYVDLFGLLFPLICVFSASFTSFFGEFIYQILFMKRRNPDEILFDIKHNYAFIPGLFIGLILPYNTPLYIFVIGALLAVIVGKLLFGGFGNNIFNPALIGVLFITIMFGSTITSNGGAKNPYEIDTIGSATPLTNMNIVGNYADYEDLIEPYGSFGDFFVGTIPGSPAETSSILCIFAFIFLAITKTIKWKIPVFYIGTVFILTSILGLTNGASAWYGLFHIVSGGLLFGAIFMATDPVTSPTTNVGHVIYGIALGILTVLFRFISPYPEGVMLSILMMNMFVFLIDRMGHSFIKNKKIIILPIILLAIIATIPFFYKQNDKGVKIISKEVNGTLVEYIASSNGYDGLIEIKIIIDDGVVESIEILKIKDTYYSTIKKDQYLARLLNSQENIDKVDTVSGATVTSSAIKSIVAYVIDDYNNSNIGSRVGQKKHYTL